MNKMIDYVFQDVNREALRGSPGKKLVISKN